LPESKLNGCSRSWPYFQGADVILFPDNDSVGRAHVEQIATGLKPVARRLRLLDLARHWRDCPPGGDISDWLAKGGGSREELDALIDGAPDWEPAGDAASPNGANASPAASKALPLIWTIGEDPAGSDWLYEGLLPRVGAGVDIGPIGGWENLCAPRLVREHHQRECLRRSENRAQRRCSVAGDRRATWIPQTP
jgi:hypothetical protein